MGGFQQVDEAILDGYGLRVQAHDLVAMGLVSRDARKARVDKVLDQLVPDALSSIRMVIGLKRSACSRTARLRLGKSSFLRRTLRR